MKNGRDRKSTESNYCNTYVNASGIFNYYTNCTIKLELNIIKSSSSSRVFQS